jgi:hypothetical protein
MLNAARLFLSQPKEDAIAGALGLAVLTIGSAFLWLITPN